MHKLQEFDRLIELGLQITPLYPGTKQPILKGWTTWNYDDAKRVITADEHVNFGIVLGKIMDVEGDSINANKKIEKLIGSYKHPMYSSQKSIHHLFLSPDPAITIVKKDNIEFRGSRHQSVIPPSRLINGIMYEWIFDLEQEIPPMPDNLLQYLRNIQGFKKKIKPNSRQIKCFSCQKKEYINKKRFQLESLALREIKKRWMCHKCRDYDLRVICREIRRNVELV